jgi:flagellar assembly protein FliH
MANRLEIQFARRLASVATIRPQQASPDQEQAQLRMQEQIDAELAEFRITRAALAKAKSQFHDLHLQFCEEAEQQLLGLSMEIARKVLMQEIQAERHEVDPIVREALSRLPEQMDAVVHLHPDDLARCELAGQGEDVAGADGVSFVGDEEVSRGECLVRTLHGTVESSIDGHIDEIAQALTQSE